MLARTAASAGLFLALASSAFAGAILDRNGVPLDEGGDTPVQYIRPDTLKALGDRQLSFDAKISEVVREQIVIGTARYRAKRGAGLVMDVHTGEILGMSTYERFDAHPANQSGSQYNLASQGTYGFGLCAKAITIASGLEAGVIKPDTLLDARKPLKFGKYEIEDRVPTLKRLTPEQSLVHASNIAVTRVQMALGSENTKLAFHKAGQFSQIDVEGIELAEPMVPRYWNDLSAASVAFGSGYQISPIQAAMVIGSFANGGLHVKPTIFKAEKEPTDGKRLWSQSTADFMLAAMRKNVLEGSVSKVNFSDVPVAGLTNTYTLMADGKYIDDDVVTAFAGVFPADKPKFLVLTFLDRPKASRETRGNLNAGWNAAPIAGEIIKRIVY